METGMQWECSRLRCLETEQSTPTNAETRAMKMEESKVYDVRNERE